MTPASPGGLAWREIPTLSRAVSEHLAAEILRGRWAEGERLPETVVAEELNVSRGPVREALRILSDQGFVTLRPRLGAVVHRVSSQVIREIYELRAILEAWVCHATVALLTEEDVAACRESLADAEQAQLNEDYDRLYGAAWELRMHIYAKCPNGTVVREIEALRGRLISLPTMVWRDPDHGKRHVEEYRELVSIFARKDEDAAASRISSMMINTGEAVAAYFERLQSTSRPGSAAQGARVNR